MDDDVMWNQAVQTIEKTVTIMQTVSDTLKKFSYSVSCGNIFLDCKYLIVTHYQILFYYNIFIYHYRCIKIITCLSFGFLLMGLMI